MQIFEGESPQRVQLANSPLVRVLCQIRFAPVLAINEESRIAPIQDALRQRYPDFRREETQLVEVGPELKREMGVIWRLSEADGSARISITKDFMTVETTTYTRREHFLARVEEAVQALEESDLKPGFVSRIGVRYLDQVVGQDEVTIVSGLIKPEVQGMLALMTEGAANLVHNVQESLMSHSDTVVKARSIYLPGNQTIDPSILEPVNEVSWILDLDAFTTQRQDFSTPEIVKTAADLAEKCHRVFHWCVNPGFLNHFGGESI